VLLALARDLRQVRHAQHLALAAICASLRPTISATPPPMPASTSSNTSVGTDDAPAPTTSSARPIRDSSPPEAIFASGPKGWPGIQLHLELDAIEAGAVGALVRFRLDGDAELPVRQTELRQLRR
jgi:hypothetical protein